MLRNLSFGLLLLTILTISTSCEDYDDELYEDDFGDEFLEDRASSTVGTYQAEDRTFQSGCAERSSHAGYTGRGFMDFGGNGTMVEWNNINAPSAGQYTLVLRYANGSAGNRQCAITVNDTTNAGNVTFGKTGAWTTWSTNSIKVTLRQGKNKIRVTANTGSGGPNLDKMDLISNGDTVVVTGRCALVNENSTATLSCPSGQVIKSIDFASYGLPTGSCSAGFSTGTCHASSSKSKVQSLCLNRQSCNVGANNGTFGDPCPGKAKKLAVVYTCGGGTVVDSCPNDPNKTEPGKCGCGVPEGTCGGKITHIGTTQVWDSDGQNINIARPSGSRSGDLLVLVLHRTDDDLPLYVNGWTRVAECYKKDNGYDCSTEKDCSSWHNDDFCGTFRDNGGHGGHDLAQSVFFRKVGSSEAGSYRFNLNRDSSGHPGWIILTALRGAATSNPVRDWSYKGCDGVEDSLFPSVYGNSGDMVLLSQSFDDKIAKSKFNAPDGTSTFGYVSNSDEAGFLFGGILSSTGETGTMKTHGDGGPSCKDALVSLTIKPQ